MLCINKRLYRTDRPARYCRSGRCDRCDRTDRPAGYCRSGRCDRRNRCDRCDRSNRSDGAGRRIGIKLLRNILCTYADRQRNSYCAE